MYKDVYNNREKLIEKAYELRTAGNSYTDIATKLGIGKGTAHSYVKQAIKSATTNTAESARESRDLDLARVDKAILTMQEQLSEGDLKAVDTLLKCLNHRAKLLGLYAEEAADMKKEENQVNELIKQDVSSMTDEDLNQFFENYLNKEK